jgi:hypothetical protein
MEFRKLQSLVELELSGCSELGCFLDSIVDFSQVKRFRLQGCHKLENLLMKFRKLQSLVEPLEENWVFVTNQFATICDYLTFVTIVGYIYNYFLHLVLLGTTL